MAKSKATKNKRASKTTTTTIKDDGVKRGKRAALRNIENKLPTVSEDDRLGIVSKGRGRAAKRNPTRQSSKTDTITEEVRRRKRVCYKEDPSSDSEDDISVSSDAVQPRSVKGVAKRKPKLARPLDDEFAEASRDWRSRCVIDY